MRLALPPDVRAHLATELARAGSWEIGGQLFGEQLAPSNFRVLKASVQRHGGTVATFSVSALHAWLSAFRFFRRTKRHFTRYNYLGEWHSHPSFDLYPSHQDDLTMRSLVAGRHFKGAFAVLVIAKLVQEELTARAWVYLPDGSQHDVNVSYEEDTHA